MKGMSDSLMSQVVRKLLVMPATNFTSERSFSNVPHQNIIEVDHATKTSQCYHNGLTHS